MMLIWRELTDESDGLGYSVPYLKKICRGTFFKKSWNVQELFEEFQVEINKIQGFENIGWEYSVFFIFLGVTKAGTMSNTIDDNIKM